MDEKLDIVEELGAVKTVNAAETDPVKAVTDLTDGGTDVSPTYWASRKLIRTLLILSEHEGSMFRSD